MVRDLDPQIVICRHGGGKFLGALVCAVSDSDSWFFPMVLDPPKLSGAFSDIVLGWRLPSTFQQHVRHVASST